MNPSLKIASILTIIIAAVTNCSQEKVTKSTVTGEVTTKLLSEREDFIWSIDSNRYVHNMKTKYFYVNGLIDKIENYLYSNYFPGKAPGYFLFYAYIFRYDELKRISMIDRLDVADPTFIETKFAYIGNSTQLSTCILYEDHPGAGGTGSLVPDYSLYDSTDFSYASQSKTMWLSLASEPGGYGIKSDYIYDIDHNAISITNSDRTGKLLSKVAYTYDNHPNPYFRPNGNFLSSDYTDPNYFDSQNNVTRTVFYGNGTAGEYVPAPVTYTYTYDADGYPITMIRSETLYLNVMQVFKYY